jgi:hypothetical protein
MTGLARLIDSVYSPDWSGGQIPIGRMAVPQNIDVSRIPQLLMDTINEESGNGRAAVSPKRLIEVAAQKLGSSSENLKMLILTQWNELVRGGLLGIGTTDGYWDPNTYFVTQEGRRALDHASRDPSNPAGYLAYLDQEGILDLVARSYVEEALNTYRASCYKATAVLIGAAVEKLILDLRDTLHTRLRATNRRVPKGLDAWQVKTALEAAERMLLDDLNNEVKSTNDENLRKLLEEAEARLSPIAADFRRTRNSAGHPASLDPVNPADVHANLLLFPFTANLLARLKDWVTGHYV